MVKTFAILCVVFAILAFLGMTIHTGYIYIVANHGDGLTLMWHVIAHAFMFLGLAGAVFSGMVLAAIIKGV
jgi:hypothetical protein